MFLSEMKIAFNPTQYEQVFIFHKRVSITFELS